MILKKGLTTLGITLLCSVSLGAFATNVVAAEESTNSSASVEQTSSSTLKSTDSSTTETSKQESSSSTESSTSGSKTEETKVDQEGEKETETIENPQGEKSLEVKKGSKFTYRLVFQVSNSKVYKSLVLKDDLEDVLKVHEAKVYLVDQKQENTEDDEDNLTEITDEGKLTIDQKSSLVTWEANEPKKYFGSTLYLDIVAEIKEDADLTAYETEDGKSYKIPNQGLMITDDEETPTDEVIVTSNPDPVKPKEAKQETPPTSSKELPQTGSYNSFNVIKEFFSLLFN